MSGAVLTRDGAVELRDRRELSYAEYGSSSGAPVIYFHGLPGSRLDPMPFAEDYAARDIRLLALERPGYGCSSRRRDWTLIDWAGDVVEFVDALGIDHFALLGYSTGGKYAAACGFSIPERVTAVGIVSGVAPPSMPQFRKGLGRTDRLSMTLAVRARPLALAYWRAAGLMAARRPERFLAEFEKELSSPDRAVIGDPNLRRAVVQTSREALRNGAHGAVDDSAIQARDWGFDPGEIRVQVRLWHGDTDELVPLSHSRYMATAISGSELVVFPGEGHLLVPHFTEIATKLALLGQT